LIQNVTWSSDVDFCADPQTKANCHHAAFNLTPQVVGNSLGFNDYITIKNVKLRSTKWTAIFEILSPPPPATSNNHITVEGLTIESPADYHTGQAAPQGIITVLAADTHFTGVTYTPIVFPNSVPANLNNAALIRPGSKNTTIDITIRRPDANYSWLGDRVLHTTIDEHTPGNETVGLNNGCSITTHFAN
jgi:hypothetical protein